ncbi:DUF3134 domain-containing protein [Limnospira indica]|uniref:DUF3134 domain-containing protein n=1 Tax=Limnospira indica TaxID=147322 RepID=UPI001862C373|nr:DUF3134 domain-containing protein [Limnospira indica]QNH57325.1 MAG: DUF3134 domain-containing protein [Limnospira indica BM01]
MQNPSLRETPSHEPADVIRSKQQVSLLDWLTQTGRLIPRDTVQEPVNSYRPDEEEISELMVDDPSYVDEDESDDEIDED